MKNIKDYIYNSFSKKTENVVDVQIKNILEQLPSNVTYGTDESNGSHRNYFTDGTKTCFFTDDDLIINAPRITTLLKKTFN